MARHFSSVAMLKFQFPLPWPKQILYLATFHSVPSRGGKSRELGNLVPRKKLVLNILQKKMEVYVFLKREEKKAQKGKQEIFFFHLQKRSAYLREFSSNFKEKSLYEKKENV